MPSTGRNHAPPDACKARLLMMLPADYTAAARELAAAGKRKLMLL